MEEDEIWLSEEEDEYEDEDFTDSSSFTMALTYQGPPGEFRTRNRPGEIQRPHVSVFHAGPRRKSAFAVSCNATAMVHGLMGGESLKKATLLVYEFKFRSYRGARLKGADITFEFQPQPGGTGRVEIVKVRPERPYTAQESEQTVGNGIKAGVNGGFMQAVGLELGAEHSVEKVAKFYTVVTGDRQQNDWGEYDQARFSLSENKSQQDGIPSTLTACILLERDDEEFVCVPSISVEPDFRTTVATLFSTRDPDDPVYFDGNSPPFDRREQENRIAIDPANLGATDLDQLWGFSMFHKYHGAARSPKREE
ncbi:hypothetical protein AnigIFM60653_007802 [Aspergillus niger]|uniref:Uncharacterized protein n=1 Tax=Aspergillus welwitschiae TaxID=1341132 RepID=A0A3F3QGK9_9EURO|nr:hypothetical protein BDQ94DRAFT_135966 [Aspergillus welwitschiae]RDH38277.1 hypothetical protein BDQ94DRAFT_135966 [Aspergillus welwitschiae]GKZ72723.1 hypothetical protein AnigIFM50267_009102 [Aspergillus niger]GLA06854.1 hypothetical protein AnigIFM60653_007802 [Aspergillus niger]GLA16172.1 hypothetical protein AnigIFM62618_002741 [Aspergillus niger]